MVGGVTDAVAIVLPLVVLVAGTAILLRLHRRVGPAVLLAAAAPGWSPGCSVWPRRPVRCRCRSCPAAFRRWWAAPSSWWSRAGGSPAITGRHCVPVPARDPCATGDASIRISRAGTVRARRRTCARQRPVVSSTACRRQPPPDRTHLVTAATWASKPGPSEGPCCRRVVLRLRNREW